MNHGELEIFISLDGIYVVIPALPMKIQSATMTL